MGGRLLLAGTTAGNVAAYDWPPAPAAAALLGERGQPGELARRRAALLGGTLTRAEDPAAVTVRPMLDESDALDSAELTMSRRRQYGREWQLKLKRLQMPLTTVIFHPFWANKAAFGQRGRVHAVHINDQGYISRRRCRARWRACMVRRSQFCWRWKMAWWSLPARTACCSSAVLARAAAGTTAAAAQQVATRMSHPPNQMFALVSICQNTGGEVKSDDTRPQDGCVWIVAHGQEQQSILALSRCIWLTNLFTVRLEPHITLP